MRPPRLMRSLAAGSSAFVGPLRRPCLDGLGPVGGDLMTDHEYVEVSSLVQRAALLAGLMYTLGTARAPQVTLELDLRRQSGEFQGPGTREDLVTEECQLLEQMVDALIDELHFEVRHARFRELDHSVAYIADRSDE